MKKKVIIFCIVITFICVTLFVFNALNLNENKVIDFTGFSDEDIYYQKFSELFNPNTSDYRIKFENTEKRICITYIDSNLEPISDAEISIYDEEGYFIIEKKANSKGEIAISNLEYDTTYYFKQTETSEGLKLDETMYKLVIEEGDNSFYKTIINSDKELSNEEKDKLLEEYKKKISTGNTDEDEKKTYLLYGDEYKKERDAVFTDEKTFILLRDELNGLKLIFTVNSPGYYDDKVKIDCAVRISNAFIKEYTIEKMYDEKNVVKIMDSNENVKTEFKDGERFYLEIDKDKYTADELYKFYITFEYNDKTYKISKTVDLDVFSTIGSGRIEATFYSPDNVDELWIKGKVKLEGLRGNTDEVKNYIGFVRTGSDGKITYYNVPKGRYKLTKIQNKEDVDSKIVEVKVGEITEVEF